VDDSVFNIIRPESKKYIKKYHHALIGVNFSERACVIFESLKREGLSRCALTATCASEYLDRSKWR
jgi:hypothetical protein